MKLSVSLPEKDVEFIDDYAARTDIGNRSEVLRVALELLRAAQLEDAYAEAWDEWAEDADTSAWDSATADGTDGATVGAGAH